MATERASIPFIGVRAYRNRTPSGRRTATPTRWAARYLAFGRERQAGQAAEERGEQRGQWVGPDGGVRSHEAVLAWAREGALGHRYTFQALLSVQQGALEPEDFTQAMERGGLITDWRLMVHRDTDYRHAHVLFFGDKRLQKETLLAWQEQVREELARLEEEQLSGQDSQKALGLEQEIRKQERGHERAQAWEVGLG